MFPVPQDPPGAAALRPVRIDDHEAIGESGPTAEQVSLIRPFVDSPIP